MKTNIYALTDSHQESRNLARILSGIYNFEKNNTEPFIILDGGDLFKGIYDRNLSVDEYLKIKQLLPQAQIFLTLGNNDFGFKKSDFEFLKNTILKFKNAGIEFVCANMYESKTGKMADLVPQYKILEINGKKVLITGFCVNNSCAKNFGYLFKPMEEAYAELIKTIKDSYEKVIVLSHHWYSYSKDLKEFSKNTSAEINLIIGGHEHSPIPPDYERKIFYPYSFARSLYKIALDNDFDKIEEIPLEKLDMVSEFENPILRYEQETKIKEPVAKRLLDLTKKYSDPCPLGTFISDNMKRLGHTDIAFHSTGFTMAHIPLGESKVITEYDIDRVICKDSSFICKMELSASDLKQVFDNATSVRMYRNRGNSKFVQCSGNITLTGKGNPEDKTYKITQINIDGVDLLDKNGEVANKNKKYTCTTDAYIATGEQGFDVLKNIPSVPILDNGEKISLNQVLYKSLLYAEKTFDGNPQYPCFNTIDLV